MSVFSQTVEFLPAKTELMVSVKPAEGISPEVAKSIISNLDTTSTRDSVFVPLTIEDSLLIEFSVSKNGKLHKKLRPCKCSSPIKPDTELTSLNHAYQEISSVIETNRSSVGGKVYDHIFFLDTDKCWKPLDIRRDRLYEPHAEEFEKFIRVKEQQDHGYVKPLPESQKLFAQELQLKDTLLKSLNLENSELRAQIEELTALIESSKLAVYRKKIEEFKERLEDDCPESAGNDSWQEWIYRNNWIFGIQYGDPIGHPKVGFRSILDYLFPTPDGFVDILEIKKPSHAVIIQDQSHPGAFKWAGEVNAAIGQVVNYLYEIELHQLEIAKLLKQEYGFEIATIKPRAFILVGRSDKLDVPAREALRKLNHALHGIEVLTYTDLLHRAENLLSVYAE